MQQSNLLREASLKDFNHSRVTILGSSHNERFQVDWKDVVPGNIIELEDDSICLCDAVILSGQCLVEESGNAISMLTKDYDESTSKYLNEIFRLHISAQIPAARVFQRNLQCS